MWKKEVFILFGLLLVVTNQDRDFLVLELQRGQVGEYYHVVMEIGTPPQRQSFDVDTGSPTLTLKCGDCGKDCQNSLYPNYEPSRSTTNVPILCVAIVLFRTILILIVRTDVRCLKMINYVFIISIITPFLF